MAVARAPLTPNKSAIERINDNEEFLFPLPNSLFPNLQLELDPPIREQEGFGKREKWD